MEGFGWLLIATVLVAAFLFVRGRRKGPWRDEANEVRLAPHKDINRVEGDQAELFPERTGSKTMRELGARLPDKAKPAQRRDASPAEEQAKAEYLTWQYVTPGGDAPTMPRPTGDGGAADDTKAAREQGADTPQTATTDEGKAHGRPPKVAAVRHGAPETRTAHGATGTGPEPPTHSQAQDDPEQAKVRREVKPGPHEHGPGTNPNASLPPEAEFGENRTARRTTAPDQQPTQWEPEQSGVPGDHYRDGHHRSATGPERVTSTKDPRAHAPIPGPNHLIPEDGQELPPGTHP